MTKSIEGASGLVNIFGPFAKILDSFFKWVTEADIDIDEVEEVQDQDGNISGRKFTATTANGNKIHVKIVQAAGRRDIFDMYCVSDTNKQKPYTHITEDQIDDKLQEFIEEVYGLDSKEDESQIENDFNISQQFDASSSTKLQVMASKDIESGQLNIHKVFANYDPVDAYEDIEEVLLSDEFDQDEEIVLTNEPICIEITTDENDEYDVVVIQDIEPMDYVSMVIQKQYETIFKLQDLLRFNASQQVEYFKQYIEIIQSQQNFLYASKLVPCGDAFSLYKILSQINLDAVFEATGSEDQILEDYCTTLELFQNNFPHEWHHLIDEWVLTLRYTLNL